MDMRNASDKLIVSMIHPAIFVIAHVYQAIIPKPPIGMDETF
jgi:hypothetical protein